MKKIISLSYFLLLLFSVGLFTACNDEDDDPNPIVESQTDIVDLAVATPELSILVDALTRADLVTALEAQGPFTVFAPTNDAFAAFLNDNNFASLEDVPVDVLTQVLLNHVVSGENTSGSLTTGYVSTLSTAGVGGANLSLFVDTQGGVTLNGISSVSQADVDASNGVIHIVDAVIGLPNVVDHATANADFSELVGALTANGQTTFTDLLSDAGTDFTVFAPVNSAFSNFSNPNNNDINNILANHVLVGQAAQAAGLSNSYVTTAATNADGDAINLYINTDNGVNLNGGSAVAVADVIATNGVIHAVDQVIDLPTVVTFAVADPMFAPLVTALTEGTPNTDFVAILSGDGPFTVFAPSEAAFQALLDSNAEWNGVTDIEEGLLTSVLQHHVLNGNIRSEDLTDGAMVPTLEGDELTINLPGTDGAIADITDGSGTSGIGVIAVDVQANNGVVHVVNQVLIPNTNN